MTVLDKTLYTAKVHTAGGRDGGTSRSDDARLQLALSQPGTPGAGTNPEQLLAAGWSACFLSAIKLVAFKRRIVLPAEIAIDAEVDLGTANGGYGLAARLRASLPGIDPEIAQSLVEAASQTCPYSLAIKGNIDVRYSVATAESGDRDRVLEHV